MENATKAIAIAGGVLVALLVISLLILGWNKISDYKVAEEESKKIEKITDFNKEFESYNKSVIRGYELLSLSNLANDSNNRYLDDQGYQAISVYAMFCNESDGEFNKSARLPGATDLSRETGTNNKYYNILKYISDYWGKLSSDDKKEFKELYFECTDVEYEKTSGRVCGFKYKQIFKTGTK